jgi:cell division protein FtsB
VSDSYYGDLRQRRDETVWHRLNRLVLALMVLAALVAIGCLFLPLLNVRRDQAERVEQLKGDIEKQKLALQRRQREVDLLQNDPAYIETIARDRLEVMKEGETIFRLDPPPPDTSDFKLRKTP